LDSYHIIIVLILLNFKKCSKLI